MVWVEVNDRQAPGRSGRTFAWEGQYPRYRVELARRSDDLPTKVPVMRFWIQWGAEDSWGVVSVLPFNLLEHVLATVGTLRRFSKNRSRFEDGSVGAPQDDVHEPAEAAPDGFEPDDEWPDYVVPGR